MNVSGLFRNLVGVADPEIILLRPLLKRDDVNIENLQALRHWCLSGSSDRLVGPMATSKMVLLGLLQRSDVGEPFDLLPTKYVSKFPPASFLKWRMLQNENGGDDVKDSKFLLDFPVSERYPPALTALAFKKKSVGHHDQFEKLILDAANFGDPLAMNLVGNQLLSVSNSTYWARGLEFIHASADAGFFLSCIRLEGIYRSGDFGIPIDHDKAEYYAAASSVAV